MQASAKNENDQVRKIVFPVLHFDLVQSPTILQPGTLHNSVGKNIILSLRIQFWSRQIQTLFCLIKDTKSQEQKSEKSDFVEEAFYLSNLPVKWPDSSYGKFLFSSYMYRWIIGVARLDFLKPSECHLSNNSSFFLDSATELNADNGMQFYKLKVFHQNFPHDQPILQWKKSICHHQKCTGVHQQQAAA